MFVHAKVSELSPDHAHVNGSGADNVATDQLSDPFIVVPDNAAPDRCTPPAAVTTTAAARHHDTTR